LSAARHSNEHVLDHDGSMLAKHLLVPAAMLLPLACSNGSHGSDSHAAEDALGDDARIVPEGLGVTALAGGNGVLDVVALTLREGARGPEVYAALQNTGEVPACHAAFSFELFDAAEQSLAAGIGGLLTQRFYRLTDGTGTIAACVAPGDVTMAAVTDLPADVTVEDVAHVVYRCPYFALDVVPVAGLAIERVKSVTASGGTAFTGTLVNELDVAVSDPSVSVFPVNRAGRPLGMASGRGTVELLPGASWAFETDSVDAPAVEHVAYPAGALAMSTDTP
jgi:hypothetical protein